MRPSQIDQLIAISEHGGIRAAARSLGISAPALTKGLNAMERTYGVELVQRSVRGAAFTPFGVALLRRARAMRVEITRSFEEIAQMRGGTTGMVAVGVSPVPAAFLLPVALEAALRTYPDMRLRVTDTLFPDALERLRNGEFDCLVGPMPLSSANAGFTHRPLFFSEVGVLGRRGHPLERSRSVNELVDARWVIIGSPGGPAAMMDALFAEAGLPHPKVVVLSDSLTTIYGFLAKTDLLTLLPVQLAGPGGPLEGVAARIDVLANPLTRRVSVITVAGKPLTPAAQRLTAALKQAGRTLQWN